MQKTNYGLTAWGEALPKFKRLCLSDASRHGTTSRSDGLDTHRRGWWIRHPQAVNQLRAIHTYSPLSGTQPGGYPFLGAWVGSQRKRPHCAFVAERGLAATRSTIALISYGIPFMIYTFLIQHSRTCRLAELRRIRTISAIADTEQQARSTLAGLPLVCLSRTPNKGVAA